MSVCPPGYRVNFNILFMMLYSLILFWPGEFLDESAICINNVLDLSTARVARTEISNVGDIHYSAFCDSKLVNSF